MLDNASFDAVVDAECATFSADGVGPPILAPNPYFRLLFGYFEGLNWEGAITWRAADLVRIRKFLDIELHAAPSDHSTL